MQFLQERQWRFGEQWLSNRAKNEAVLSAKAEAQLILLRSCFGEPAGHKQHMQFFSINFSLYLQSSKMASKRSRSRSVYGREVERESEMLALRTNMKELEEKLKMNRIEVREEVMREVMEGQEKLKEFVECPVCKTFPTVGEEDKGIPCCPKVRISILGTATPANNFFVGENFIIWMNGCIFWDRCKYFGNNCTRETRAQSGRT